MAYELCVDEPRLQAKQRHLAAKEFSAGIIAFYWAVNKRCQELQHHNVFLSSKGMAPLLMGTFSACPTS